MTVLSCGILLLSDRHDILLCHSTGNTWWDILKGRADPGEEPVQAAVREAFEESGIQFHPDELLELGHMPYYPGKDLHLFVAHRRRDQLDVAACRCTSYFNDPRRGGRPTLEVDDFKWVAFADIPSHCTKNMTQVLSMKLDLAALADRFA